MLERLPPLAGRSDSDAKAMLELLLADEGGHTPRPQLPRVVVIPRLW